MDNIDIQNIDNMELVEMYKNINGFIQYLEQEMERIKKQGEEDE